MSSSAKILIQAIGNPLRSDDAVGPLLIERLSNQSSDQFGNGIDFEWVYQLQIENAEQWRHYERVIVIDADIGASEPFIWREISQTEDSVDEEFGSHQQTPEAIFRIMRQFFETSSKPLATRVYILGLQAEIFDIGETLSAKSKYALQEAEKFILKKLEKELSTRAILL